MPWYWLRLMSEDAALLRELGIALLSKLEQLSQRARWPVAGEKHKTSSFAMIIWKHPLRRPRSFTIMYNPDCLAVNILLKEV